MPKTPTGNFNTEKNKSSGAKIRTLLEIQAGTELAAGNALWDADLVAVWHMNGDWLDAKGSNDGTRFGSGVEFTAANQQLGSAAGVFNGSDDRTDFGDPTLGSGAVSVSGWIRGNAQTASVIIDKSNWTNASDGFRVNIDGTGKLHVDGFGLSEVTSNATVLDGNWHFFVAVFGDGVSTKIYVDGGAAEESAPDADTYTDGATTCSVGARQNGTLLFKGLIDELAIWKRGLSHAETVTLYEEQKGTYYSDQTLTVSNQGYTANVLAWPNRIASQIVPGEEVVRTSSMGLTLNNNPRIDLDIRPGLIVRLYMWFDGLAATDKLLWFKGVISEGIEYDIYKLNFAAMDIGDWFNKQIGIPLDATTYPNADPDDIGKIQPIVYGDVKNHPCLAILAGAVSTLLDDISAGASSIELSDASAFPSSGTLIIGDEEDITYSGKSSNTLIGVANVSFDYPRSTRVMEKIAQLEYMVANHPVKAITNPRILPFGLRLEDAVRIDSGDFAANVDDSGIATVDITNIANVKKAVELAASENDPGHPHTTTGVSLVQRHTASFSNPGGYANPTNAFDFADNTYASLVPATGGIFELNFTGFPTTDLGTIQEVRIVVKSELAVSGTLKILYPGGNNTLGNSLATRKFITGITSWGSLNNATFQTSNAFGNESRCYEVYYEVDYIPAIASNVTSLTVAITGTSVADTLGGILIVDCKGHPDDNPAHYTDVADSLIEEPWDVIHHILENYGNGVTDADIDLAGSFQDAEDNLPASYKFAFTITQKIDMNHLLARLAQQTWCRFVWEAGLAMLNWIKDSGASAKSIDTDTDSYVSKENRHLVTVRQRGLGGIFNDVEVKYNLNLTLGGWDTPDAYQGSATDTDASSIALYQTRQRTWNQFAIGDNSSMADDIRDKLLAFYKVNRKEVSFPGWLKNAEIERGDLIELTTSQLGLDARLNEVIGVDYVPPNPINKQRPELIFTFLDLLFIFLSLTDEAEIGDVLTKIDVDAVLTDAAQAGDVLTKIDVDAVLTDAAQAGDEVKIDITIPQLADAVQIGDALTLLKSLWKFDSTRKYDSSKKFNSAP